jgi:hypothetical protein
MVSATRVPNNRTTFEGAIGSIGVSRVVDRLITPTAHYLASSGIGSARLQFSCSPRLVDLWTAPAEAAGTDVAVYGSSVIINFHRLRFIPFPDVWMLHWPHGEVRIALRNETQWKPTLGQWASRSVIAEIGPGVPWDVSRVQLGAG